MQLLSLVFQILCSTAAAKKISVDRNEKSFCGWITQKKCIFHGGQLRYQAQDNLIGLLACYLANKVCAAAVDRNHYAWETMISFKKFKPSRVMKVLSQAEPSRAKLGHFNLRAETELKFLFAKK